MVMEMSKTYKYRKVMKPLLERKRRARINKCLDDLKDIMVECLTQEGEHVTRLEKADILELTVEHMRKLKQRGGLMLHPNVPATTQLNAHVVESFRSGYVHAADQITQVLLLRQHDEVGGKIMKFLSSRLSEMQTHHSTLSSAMTIPIPTSNTAASAISKETNGEMAIDVITVENSNAADFTGFPQAPALEDDAEVVWRPW